MCIVPRSFGVAPSVTVTYKDAWDRLRWLLNYGLIRNIRNLNAAKGLGRWLGKGFWAVMDQGLFASSNFVLNVLLARWLVSQDYGAFTIAYTTFWLFSILHTGLLSQPMLIFGSSKYRDRLPEYLGVLLYGHVIFTILGSGLYLLACLGFWLLGWETLSSAMLGLALASTFILFLWLMRRVCLIHLKPHLAALGGALYMAPMMLGIYVVYQGGWLSPATAFVLMGFASLVASLWLARRLRVSPSRSLTPNELSREAFSSHWSYGRWAAATGVLGWIPLSVYYLLLPIWGGLEASAALRALMNFIIPVGHAVWALAIFLIPYLVQARGSARFGRIVRLTLALFVCGTALYGVLLISLRDPLVAWLYGGQYSEYTDLLWMLALLPVFQGVTVALVVALQALERPDLVLWASVLTTIVTLTVGVGAVVLWGVSGAAVGLVLSEVTAAGALVGILLTHKVSTGGEECK